MSFHHVSSHSLLATQPPVCRPSCHVSSCPSSGPCVLKHPHFARSCNHVVLDSSPLCFPSPVVCHTPVLPCMSSLSCLTLKKSSWRAPKVCVVSLAKTIVCTVASSSWMPTGLSIFGDSIIVFALVCGVFVMIFRPHCYHHVGRCPSIMSLLTRWLLKMDEDQRSWPRAKRMNIPTAVSILRSGFLIFCPWLRLSHHAAPCSSWFSPCLPAPMLYICPHLSVLSL